MLASGLTFPMVACLAVLAALLYGLIRDFPTDMLFIGAVVLLAALGVITPEDAFGGFGIRHADRRSLFIVAAAPRKTG